MLTKKLEIISRKAIKPSSPTPKHLQTFKLSFWDQRHSHVYGTVAFFYHSNADLNDHDEILSTFYKRSHSLQKSLSETLVHYYPLAGRLKDDESTIACNDEGAHFVEAYTDCQLSTFLAKPEVHALKNLTAAFDTSNIPSGCMLVIQLTLFSCGGIAISVSTSHKLADASSVGTFVQSWASITTQEGGRLVSPEPMFVESSFSPTTDMLSMPTPFTTVEGSLVTKRIVFPASKIAKLEGSIISGQQYLTVNDLVLSLILKCAISSARSLSKSSSGPYVLFHAVNMRKRLPPPLPENTIGNIIWCITVEIEEDQQALNELAGNIRQSLNKLYSTAGSSSSLKENNKERPVVNIKGNPYFCSSICGFPIYETDFGWGKPSWATAIPFPERRNFIVLQKTKEGNGIEAWICLEKKEMAQFETDHELLAFACTELAVLPKRSRM
ncbi:hypothetical protein K2173_018090 [Erythroxylum novogranatense]|uniref:Uncharacterized protein n=1 Tax=Erythroxylum novogranatense TaxID=1862640 RepID=A0AAV8TX23_9ROSI|nr:hypothetical protein K2173_018090 [Erythroxylum novogranatense]